MPCWFLSVCDRIPPELCELRRGGCEGGSHEGAGGIPLALVAAAELVRGHRVSDDRLRGSDDHGPRGLVEPEKDRALEQARPRVRRRAGRRRVVARLHLVPGGAAHVGAGAAQGGERPLQHGGREAARVKGELRLHGARPSGTTARRRP